MTSTQASGAYNMEDGPIYSAEQIEIPKDLALVLKLYTKAVIRAQPKDVVQFSRDYFYKLEHQTGIEEEENRNIFIKKLYVLSLSFISRGSVQEDVIAIQAACEHVKLAQTDVQAILKLLGVTNPATAKVNWIEFIAFGATLISENLMSTMQVCYQVLGGGRGVTADKLVTVWRVLTNLDRSLNRTAVDRVTHFLEKQGINHVSLAELEGQYAH